VILLDTSGLLSALFPDQRHHQACAQALARDPGPFVMSPFVLAELDYLIGRHAGPEAQRALLTEIAIGAYELAAFDSRGIATAERILRGFGDQEIGLADASIVVLSERFGVVELLSLDERHFRTLRGHRGRPFRLLPFDA
jgi:predicted nucleic acid-binding protein